MVRHVAVEAKPAEPAIGEVEMHFLAEPPLRADAEAITNNQHPDHQFGIDRRPPNRAVEGSEVSSHLRQVDEAIDRSQEMITWHMPLEREVVEQLALLDALRSHHRLSPSAQRN